MEAVFTPEFTQFLILCAIPFAAMQLIFLMVFLLS